MLGQSGLVPIRFSRKKDQTRPAVRYLIRLSELAGTRTQDPLIKRQRPSVRCAATLGRPVQVSAMGSLFLAIAFSSDFLVLARLYMLHPLLHDLAHASKSLLNLRTIRHIPGREFIPA
jgi:hypothetical protein